jgi:microcystin-dependent protein
MKKISDFNSATEKYPVVYAGSATRPEYVDMPTILQQQEGVAPMDTCPAQWWNAMWKLATRDINAFRDYVGDAFTEINNLLTKFNITLDDADSEQLYDFFHDDYVQNYISTVLHTINGDLHVKGDLSVDGIGEEIISTELKVDANTITLRNDNPSALGNTELAGIVTENYDGNNHNNIIAIRNNGEARTGDIDIATRILYSNNGTNFYTDEDLTIPATIGATEEVRDTGNQTSGGVEIYEGITYSNDDTQPLLTRAESSAISDGHYLKWDAANKRAVDGGGAIDMFFPVGSLYWTGKAPNDGGDPNVLFGGTWVQIKDRFILAAGDTYTNGATGGEATVTLTTNEMPSHSHTYTPSGTVTSSFSGIQDSITVTGAVHNHGYTYVSGTGSNGGLQLGVGTASVGFVSDSGNLSMSGVFTPSGTVTSSFSGDVGLHTSDEGTGQAHNNMPPYIVKYCWERTA